MYGLMFYSVHKKTMIQHKPLHRAYAVQCSSDKVLFYSVAIDFVGAWVTFIGHMCVRSLEQRSHWTEPP